MSGAPATGGGSRWSALGELAGELRVDAAACAAAATDFGRAAHLPPQAVLFPRQIEDVVAAIRFARAERIPVALRGAGHAASQLTLREHGLVIQLRSLGRVLDVNAAARWVDVQGGATWATVFAATLPLGLMPAITVDFAELTVGGTLSTGGVGAQSFWAGVLADQVLELAVVTGAGELRCCSPSTEVALFELARAGLGQVGAIVRARLRLVAAPPRLRLHQLFFATLPELLAAVASLRESRRADTLLALALPVSAPQVEALLGPAAQSALLQQASQSETPNWLFRLDAGVYLHDAEGAAAPRLDDAAGWPAPPHLRSAQELAIADFLLRAPPLMQREQLRSPPHPELILFLPTASAQLVIGATLRTQRQEDLGGGPVLLIPLRMDAVRASQLRLPAAPHGYLFSLLRVASPATAGRIAELTARNLALYELAVAHGATRYPCDALPLPVLDAARRAALLPHLPAFDPDLILTAERIPYSATWEKGGCD